VWKWQDILLFSSTVAAAFIMKLQPNRMIPNNPKAASFSHSLSIIHHINMLTKVIAQ
jgi:hypothetical protein